jgi:protein-S-isoprenylcysteine O-methyltransferase Ste14
MQRIKPILIAALIGAVVGLLSHRFHLYELRHLPAFAFDPVLRSYKLYWKASVAGWVVFSLYWEVAAGNVAKTKSSESLGSRRVHLFLTTVGMILELAPIHGLGRFLPALPPLMSVGLAIEAAGLFLAIWSRRHLGKYWSGEITIKVEHQLIRSGPYRILRHPIYTGLPAMYLGTVFVTGEWLALIGLAMALFAYWRKIRLEEANLDVAFGVDYDAYRRDTWALVPGLF